MNRCKLPVLALSVLLIAAAAHAAPVRVLHISAFGQDELRGVLSAIDADKQFDIDMVTLEQGLPAGWMEYDVLVFGLSDTYETRVSKEIEALPDLRAYVEKGGGIVWTHDTLEFGGSWGADIEEPAGVEEVGAQRIGMRNGKIRIAQDHPILNVLYAVGRAGDVFETTRHGGFSHSGGGIVTSADIIVDHAANEAPNNFYLTVNEYGRGRVVVNEIGHSVIGYGGEVKSEVQPIEAMLLANSIYWAARGAGELGRLLPEPQLAMVPGEIQRVRAAGDVQVWLSSDDSIVSVDANGKLTAHKRGFVTLTVQGADGESDSMAVYVTEDGNAPVLTDAAKSGSLQLPFRSAHKLRQQ